MTDPQVGVLMLVGFIVIIFLGFPIAFTLIALGVGFGYYAMGDNIFPLLVQRAFGVMSNDVLIAVPLFLFMGYMVERSNLLDRLFHSLQVSLKHIPGSLAVATLATCALFATATGIVGAVVTLMGLLALPAMLKAGYDTKLSAGVVAAGGCLGILIPPEHHADPLWRHGEHLRGEALCRGLPAGLPARRHVHPLCDGPGHAQSRRSRPSCPRSRPMFRSSRWSGCWRLRSSRWRS